MQRSDGCPTRAGRVTRALARLCLPLAFALPHAAGGGRAGPAESKPRPPAARDCEPAAREATAEAVWPRADGGGESLRRAAAKLEAARRCWSLAREEAAEADALSKLGEISSAFGEWDRAREFYEPAVRLRSKLGDARGEAEAACALSRAYTGLARFDDAFKF